MKKISILAISLLIATLAFGQIYEYEGAWETVTLDTSSGKTTHRFNVNKFSLTGAISPKFASIKVAIDSSYSANQSANPPLVDIYLISGTYWEASDTLSGVTTRTDSVITPTDTTLVSVRQDTIVYGDTLWVYDDAQFAWGDPEPYIFLNALMDIEYRGVTNGKLGWYLADYWDAVFEFVSIDDSVRIRTKSTIKASN